MQGCFVGGKGQGALIRLFFTSTLLSQLPDGPIQPQQCRDFTGLALP